MRLTFITAGLLLAACSQPAPPMEVGQSCPMGDTVVQVEAGYAPAAVGPGGDVCGYAARALAGLRSAYEARFGPQDLRGIVVRLRAAQDLRQTGIDVGFAVGGHTYADAIDLAAGQWTSLPHELNHVRTGSGHDGWCVDFEPWSEEVLGIDQRSYLKCN